MKKNEDSLVFDASISKRRYDENGYLYVDDCPITKEQVVGYFGIEIPTWQELGLDPKKRYFGYRPAEEIQKSMETFNGVPLLLEHEAESAKNPTDRRVGSVGTSPRWDAPYLRQPLSITVDSGIKAVETGEARQLSSSYRYDPDFTSGEFDGQHYDFIMRNIRANHVALVPKGRAGADVIVEDSFKEMEIPMEENKVEEKVEVKDEAPLNPDGSTVEVAKDDVDSIIAKIADMDEESLNKIKQALGAEKVEVEVEEKEPDVIGDAMKACGLDSDNSDLRNAFQLGRDSMTVKEDVKAMDSASFIKELADRNAYAKRISNFIGSFDSDSMTLKDVLKYGCKKLNLNVADGHEKSAIDGFLTAKTEAKTVKLANDSAITSKGDDVISKLYGGK